MTGSWAEQWAGALCAEVDPELFFPGKGESDTAADARKICNRCDIRAKCLAYALEERITDGIFGGLSPRQRRKLLPREQGPAPAPPCGTESAYRRHKSLGEDCAICKAGASAARKARKARQDETPTARSYQAARAERYDLTAITAEAAS